MDAGSVVVKNEIIITTAQSGSEELQRLETEDSNSAQQVFHIPELLELILIHVQPRQLFAIRRTCRAFELAVQNSKSLRRKMELQHTCNKYDHKTAHFGTFKRLLRYGPFSYQGSILTATEVALRFGLTVASAPPHVRNKPIGINLGTPGRRITQVQDNPSWTNTVLTTAAAPTAIIEVEVKLYGIQIDHVKSRFYHDRSYVVKYVLKNQTNGCLARALEAIRSTPWKEHAELSSLNDRREYTRTME
jgi:hypothetical protein